ncbi:MAG: diaminopimelate epimerase [Planctomycetota bacterium]
MRFTKMHGAGNDYVYVDAFAHAIHDPAALARRIADRHTGVGGDGLILAAPPDPALPGYEAASARMVMFNIDGSEGAMCGNGIRCVCKLVHDHDLGDRPTASPMVIQTASGARSLAYTLDGRGKVATVTVDMGPPQLAAGDIPVQLDGVGPADHVIDHPLGGGASPQDLVTCVSMGNPHVVLWRDDLAAIDLPRVGPAMESHPAFPDRVNAHFVQKLGEDRVRVLHWERGSGPTQACGTGACAVAVAGALTGRTGRRVAVETPGGELGIDWTERGAVLMTGPAVEVFQGDWPDPA